MRQLCVSAIPLRRLDVESGGLARLGMLSCDEHGGGSGPSDRAQGSCECFINRFDRDDEVSQPLLDSQHDGEERFARGRGANVLSGVLAAGDVGQTRPLHASCTAAGGTARGVSGGLVSTDLSHAHATGTDICRPKVLADTQSSAHLAQSLADVRRTDATNSCDTTMPRSKYQALSP